MKVLLINQTYAPDVAATAQYLTDLAEDLVAEGFSVTVLTGRRGYLDDRELYDAHEVRNGVVIERVWPFAFRKHLRFARIVNAALINLAFAWKILRLPRHDVLLPLTTPPMIVSVAVLISLFKRSRVVHWVMDLNPDQVIRAGWIRKSSFLAYTLRFIQKITLKKCAAIIAIDQHMQKLLIDKGVAPESTKVVHLWCNSKSLHSVVPDKNPFLVQNKLTAKFVVMYSGNHSFIHPLDTLLQAALELRGDETIQFVLVGGGARVAEVRAFREQHGLNNILQLPYQPREQLSESLSAADLHVISMGSDFVGVIHPSKLYGILSVERPILYFGPEESPIAEVVSQYEIGDCIEHGDVEAAVAAIVAARQRSHSERVGIQERVVKASKGFQRSEQVAGIIESLRSVVEQ